MYFVYRGSRLQSLLSRIRKKLCSNLLIFYESALGIAIIILSVRKLCESTSIRVSVLINNAFAIPNFTKNFYSL